MALFRARSRPQDQPMSEFTSQTWDELGTKLNGLGLKLKLHVEQATTEDLDLSNALQNLASSLEGAFDGLRNAAKDPAINDDVREVAASLSKAVSTTLDEVGQRLR